MKTFFIWLLMTATVNASCVTLDRSSWTKEQIIMTPAITYLVYFEAGENIVPDITDDVVCFKDSTLDVPRIINETTILDRFAIEDAILEANLVIWIAEDRAKQVKAADDAGEIISVDF